MVLVCLLALSAQRPELQAALPLAGAHPLTHLQLPLQPTKHTRATASLFATLRMPCSAKASWTCCWAASSPRSVASTTRMQCLQSLQSRSSFKKHTALQRKKARNMFGHICCIEELAWCTLGTSCTWLSYLLGLVKNSLSFLLVLQCLNQGLQCCSLHSMFTSDCWSDEAVQQCCCYLGQISMA